MSAPDAPAWSRELLSWLRETNAEALVRAWPDFAPQERLLALQLAPVEALEGVLERLFAEHPALVQNLVRRAELPPALLDRVVHWLASQVPPLEGVEKDEMGERWDALYQVERVLLAMSRARARTTGPEAWEPFFARFQGAGGGVLWRVLSPAAAFGLSTLGSEHLRLLVRSYCRYGVHAQGGESFNLLAEHPGADERVWEEMLREGVSLNLLLTSMQLRLPEITYPPLRQRLEKRGDAYVLQGLAQGAEGEEFVRLLQALRERHPLLAVETLEQAREEQTRLLDLAFLSPLLESGDAEVRLRAIALSARLPSRPSETPAVDPLPSAPRTR